MLIEAKKKVRMPGIFLLVLGIIIEIFSLLFLSGLILIHYINYQHGIYQNPAFREDFYLSQVVVLIATAFQIFTAPVIIYGAAQMLKLKNYYLSLSAAILAMLPLSICFLPGLPIGIWALVILSDKDLKAEFSDSSNS